MNGNDMAARPDYEALCEKQECEIKALNLMRMDSEEKIRCLKEEVERYRAVIKTLEFIFGRKFYD